LELFDEGYDIGCFQEVHESYLKDFQNFAKENKLFMFSELYHNIRKCHLVSLCKKEPDSIITISFNGEYNKGLGVIIDNVLTINVHLPLDIKNVGERIRVTEKFAKFTSNFSKVIILGDYNTLPSKGDDEKHQIMKKYNLKRVNVGNEGTFYGYPHEPDSFKGYTSDILDHIYHSEALQNEKTKCDQNIFESIPLSDHFILMANFIY